MKMQKKLTIAEYEFPIEINQEDGFFVAKCSKWADCYAQGDTLEEAMYMVKDAILAYIASLKKHNEPIPQEQGPSLVSVVDIPIPVTP